MKSEGADSRFSWVIATACFWIYFVMHGMNILSGLLFVATMNTFDADREEASYPYTLSFSLRFLSGPLAGYLAYKFGLRAVILFGCTIASLSIGGCFLAQSITVISILWGVLFGLGNGLATNLLPQATNLHFKKHLGKANGLASAGSSLAGFVLPPMASCLLKEYGLSGTFLFLSAIALHGLPAALILRFPKPIHVTKQHGCKNLVNRKRNVSGGDNNEVVSCKLEMSRYHAEGKRNMDNGILIKMNFTNDKKLDNESNIDKTFHISPTSFSLCKKNTNGIVRRNSTSSANMLQLKEEHCNLFPRETKIKKEMFSNQVKISITPQTSFFQKYFPKFVGKEINPKNRTFSISHTEHSCNNNFDKSTKRCDSEFPSNNTNNETNDNQHQCCVLNKVKIFFRPFVVYCDLSFIIIAITSGIVNCFSTVYASILVDFFMDKDIPLRQSTYSLMIFSLSDLIGGVSLGWVTDSHYMSKTAFSALLFYICAIAFTCHALLNGIALIFVVFLTGLCIGALSPIFACLVTEFLEQDKQTMANASIEIFAAPFSIATPALLGYFRDGLGSYNWLLYVLAMCALVSGLLLGVLLPKMDNIYKNNKNQNVISTVHS